MVGTIFRLPDETRLQRGYTFTILPDGQPIKVPAMNRIQVRSESESHDNDRNHDMVQALQDILAGKKPTQGRARFNRLGQAHGNRVGGPIEGMRAPARGGPVPFEDQGLRPAVVGGRPIAEM